MRSAIAASLANVPPKVMPGSLVCTSPVMLRISAGAVIFGSKNSICDGPPWRRTRTTALSLTTLPALEARARVDNRPESVNPPSARLPARRKSRRLEPWQCRVDRVSRIFSIIALLGGEGPARREEPGRILLQAHAAYQTQIVKEAFLAVLAQVLGAVQAARSVQAAMLALPSRLGFVAHFRVPDGPLECLRNPDDPPSFPRQV